MRIALLGLAFALGCSRPAQQGTPDAGLRAPSTPAPLASTGAGPDAQAARGASPSSAVALDYRGTLGAKTPIAMHLVRSGAEASGFYVYTSRGRPIALAGTIDPAGALLLTEGLGGKATGTLRLAPSGGEMVGEWVSPAGDKKFPVRLSPGAPWALATLDAGTSLEAQAERCLANPTCSAAEADRLFVEADNAHAKDVDCLRFIDGVGTKRDGRRGRACLERQAARSKCDGSSADLGVAELALMLIDGTSGPTDIPRARALFADCFDDTTKTSILAHADDKERVPKTPPMSFCKDNGGTTLTTNECMARARTGEITREQLGAKAVADTLDEPGKQLLASATRLYDAYVEAMGRFAYEVYVQGSIRNAVALGREQALHESRVHELASFSRYEAPPTPQLDVDRARSKAQSALAAVPVDTPAEKAALRATQDAWEAYRDAEALLYVHAFGAKQGVARVGNAILVKLELGRAKECKPPCIGECKEE